MSSPLIFLVDDEPLLRQLLEHQVTTVWGHTARTFPDAERCLAALDESPDLIIMDIGLPGIGGVEALRRIREEDPELPVIMLSAQESVEVAISTWKLGAHDYLTKPPDMVRLEASIREDLYYRISSFPVHLPPLRDRRSDILLLAEHFLKEQASRQGKSVTAISRPALRLMYQYPWPGNLRELQNAIERAVLLAESTVIADKDLPVSLRSFDTGAQRSDAIAHLFEGSEAIVPLERLREKAVRHALKVTGGNILHAARQLGVGRATLYRLMKKYGIPIDR